MATPGLVTGNVTGGTPYQSVQDQAAAYNLQKQMEKDRENEWARAAAANASLGKAPRDPKAEADAKMKAAYEMFYAPYAQSQWDVQQGQISGTTPGLTSGDPRSGPAYKKYGSGLYGEQNNIGVGQQPYEYRQDTNMPADQYQQGLDYMYEMWKAGQMMGAEDWKQEGYATKLPGGGTKGGAGQSY